MRKLIIGKTYFGRKILCIAYTLGKTMYYRVQCIKCNKIYLMHMSGIHDSKQCKFCYAEKCKADLRLTITNFRRLTRAKSNRKSDHI